MKEEYMTLLKNNTWTLIPRTSNDNMINSIWIFKIKQKEDGSIERLKARLVQAQFVTRKLINMLRKNMPHFHIEYSANLEEVLDIGQLCEAIRAEAATIDTFPMAGIRVRATRVDHYAIADGNAKHGFIDLSVRLREGRPDAVKHDAITRIFAALKAFVEPMLATRSIALSAEMRDINAALSPKFGTIRNHLEDTA